MLIKRCGSLFAFGGACYGIIEILWRGRTHWTMLITGGACFSALFCIFGKLERLSLVKKCLIGGSLITAVEFVSGCIFNRMLKLKVWDYSDRPFNLKGQICPLYSFLWTLLCVPINFVVKRLNTINYPLRRSA